MAACYKEHVSQCEEKLRRLLIKQREQVDIDNLDSLVTQRTQLKQVVDRQLLVQANDALVAKISDTPSHQDVSNFLVQHLNDSADPDQLLSRIKSRLGLDYDIAASIEMATTEYNLAVCRLLGRQLSKRLPRELRDMVWSYVVPEEIVLCTLSLCGGGLLHLFNDDCDVRLLSDEYDPATNVEIANFQPYFFTAPRTQHDVICPQYFWRDEVIGMDSARELIVSFYRTTKFHIKGSTHEGASTKRSTYVLSRFLQNDRFRLGNQPSSSISHVKLDVELCAYKRLIDFKDQAKAVRAWIQQLSVLEGKAHIEVHFNRDFCYGDMSGEKEAFLCMMKKVLSDLKHLRRAGCRLTLELGTEWNDPDVRSVLTTSLEMLDRSMERDKRRFTAA